MKEKKSREASPPAMIVIASATARLLWEKGQRLPALREDRSLGKRTPKS